MGIGDGSFCGDVTRTAKIAELKFASVGHCLALDIAVVCKCVDENWNSTFVGDGCHLRFLIIGVSGYGAGGV